MGSRLDDAEIERLYLRLEKPLFNVVYRWLWQAEEAHDLVQEAFVRLFRMRDRIEPATVEALVYRIALNLARNRRRARRLWRWVALEAAPDAPAPAPGADEALSAEERRRAVRAAVDALPEKLRAVVTLCEPAHMSYQEAAAVIEIPAGTVASRRNAAMKRLEAALGPLYADPEEGDDDPPPRPV